MPLPHPEAYCAQEDRESLLGPSGRSNVGNWYVDRQGDMQGERGAPGRSRTARLRESYLTCLAHPTQQQVTIQTVAQLRLSLLPYEARSQYRSQQRALFEDLWLTLCAPAHIHIGSSTARDNHRRPVEQ
jgi:hypothetical protein